MAKSTYDKETHPDMTTPIHGTDTAELPELEPIEGGYRVKLSDDGRHHIDVLLMIFNWRIAATPVAFPLTIDRAWCYFGRDHSSFVTAVMAAWVWDGADDSEPAGYDKAVGR